MNVFERFEAKFVAEPMSGCWLWIGALNNKGYGQVRRKEGLFLAHRYGYELYRDKIPEGLILRHTCDTPACVNPDHLEPGTYKENHKDMVNRGRARWSGQTHCKNGHEFTEDNTLWRRSRPGCRECRSCARIRSARFQENHA